MPDNTVWSLETGSEVNGEGNWITFNVKVTTSTAAPVFTGSNPVKPEETNASVDISKLGAISGYRFGTTGATLINAGDPSLANTIDGAAITDVANPVIEGSDYVVRFKLRISLSTKGRVAINNGLTAVSVYELQANLLTLHLDKPGPTDITVDSKAISHGDTNLVASPSLVGHPGGSNLKIYADAHAEAVARSNNSVTNLTLWSDISGTGTNLTGGPSGNEATLTAGNKVRPHLDLDGATPDRYFATPPSITTAATVAAVFDPNTTSSPAHIFGKMGLALFWRLYYDGTNAQVVYEARGGTTSYSVPFDVDPAGTTLVILRRRNDANKSYQCWINGVPAGSGNFNNTVNSGTGTLYVGARSPGFLPPTWVDVFTGEINQVAAYDTDIDDFQLSLLMHQMRDRALVDLGTPIPTASQTQPYLDPNSGAKRLDRRPIALLNCYGGNYDGNMFGQRAAWRNSSGQPDVQSYKDDIASAFRACDQFEIMFNRPGGNYKADLTITSPFGMVNDPNPPHNPVQVITNDQWTGMRTIWSDMNLWDYNDDWHKDANRRPKRRGWFYTGSGLPIDDSGALDTTGFMRNRQIAPATPDVYRTNILEKWSASGQNYGYDRFRCFFLDNASSFFGKMVELAHDNQINSNYILVGEAIPGDNAARKGGVWFALMGLPMGPWWKNSDKGDGYNPLWKNDWKKTPLYFGIQSGKGTPDLRVVNDDPGAGNDMTLAYIYKWVVKGGNPVSWSRDTDFKVGLAWNYGTARIMPSRITRCPRLLRSARY